MGVDVSTQHGRADGVIDLARGDPGPDLLPTALVQRAAASVAGRRDPDLLQYGLEAGDAGARAVLSDWLASEGAGRVSVDRLFLTPGASLALHLVCARWSRPGDRVLVADPTYHLALAQFADHGLRVEGVESDGGGIVVDALEEALRAAPAALLYLVPAFANPTGSTLAPERQEAVVELATRHGVRLVADEVYRLTGFEDDVGGSGSEPPRGLASLDPERVTSLNSFSKLLAPGLRLGWIEGPAADLARLAESGLLRSGGGMNPFTAALVREAIVTGELSAHLALVRERLRERHAALVAALRSDVPQAEFVPARGGYFLWVHVPGLDADSAPAREAFARHQVRVASGTPFVAGAARGRGGTGAPGDPGRSLDPRAQLRLCFAHQQPAALREGVSRLAAALRGAAG